MRLRALTRIGLPLDFPSSLQVQYRLPVHDDVDADRAGLLPATGLRREDRTRRHGPTCFLRNASSNIAFCCSMSSEPWTEKSFSTLQDI